MRKRYFIPMKLLPKSVETPEQQIRLLQDAGHYEPLYAELERRPEGLMRCRAGLRGLYLWIEYPDEPNDVTAFGVLLLQVYFMAAFAAIGLVLSYLDVWLFGAAARHELFLIRGAFFGNVATVLSFVTNRFDRVLFSVGFFVCAIALTAGLAISCWLLVSRGDLFDVAWLLILALAHRAALTDWS